VVETKIEKDDLGFNSWKYSCGYISFTRDGSQTVESLKKELEALVPRLWPQRSTYFKPWKWNEEKLSIYFTICFNYPPEEFLERELKAVYANFEKFMMSRPVLGFKLKSFKYPGYYYNPCYLVKD
jgi:hypothetical protein